MCDDSVLGNTNANVTIVEFGGYQDPFSFKFYNETFSLIDSEYIKTGKVKFVFRDFPLSFHSQAQKAAEAAECAGEQGKYYEMHNKLFESGVAGGIASFKQYAKDIGIDSAKFNDCLDSGKMYDEVQKDYEYAISIGVGGSPTFFINGEKIVGSQPYSVFKQTIEQQLS